MESLEKCTGFVAFVVAKVGLGQGRDSFAADVVAGKPQGELVRDPAGEMEIRIPMEQQEASTPALAMAATTSGSQDQRIRSSWGPIVVDRALQLHGSLLRKICSGFSDAKLHIITGTCSMLQWNRLSSEDQAQYLKRIIEFIKKAIPFESVLMAAICNHPYYYSSNTTFKICLVLVLLAFFTDFLSALLLHLKSLAFLIKYLVYTSSVTQMLMPFFLFISSGQLQFYMILVVPLPFFSVTLFHQTGSGDGAATDASALDNSFDISSWIYAFSSGGALIGPNTISIKFIAATTLACSLFLTIFIARYLMLISTLRPKVVVGHVETLMKILKLLWGLTIILFILDRFGWRATLVATTVAIVDAVLFCMPSWLLSYSSRTTDGSGDEPDDLRNNLQLLWAVMVSILFIALTRTYSEHVAAHDNNAPLGPAETRRLLIYFGAFLWSLNRMLITPGDVAVPPDHGDIAVSPPDQGDVAVAVLPDQGDIAVKVPLDQGEVAVPPDQGDIAVSVPPDQGDVAVPPDQGGHKGTMVKVWFALECARGSVVLFAALDMVTIFFTTYIMS
ncbi:unnamed protein product [Urochloa decumbens]|uniref:Uncharacterized protein n=1 Tax=Urochloa decumbens TaxID=240449 RepID=A0ABC9BAC4_9POAL